MEMTTIIINIDEELKRQAEELFSDLGIDMEIALRYSLNKLLKNKGFHL